MPQKTDKNILFIIEESLIAGKQYLGSSNDLLLILQALRQGINVFLTTPQRLALWHYGQKKANAFKALQLSDDLNWQEIDKELLDIWHREIVNCLLALPAKPDETTKQKSQILLKNAKNIAIDLNKIAIFNRAEPISLTNQFYDILIDLKQKGATILPCPLLNKALGDKLAIYGIHYQKKIANIDLLEDVKFAEGQNQISFATEIITISNDNLNAGEIANFYDLLAKKDFVNAKKLFADELEIFMKGAKKYLDFHQKLGNDSILKPANYFGGAGVVASKNQKLDLDLAVQNIVRSFLAIKEDSSKNNQQNLAFLNQIIVQERANQAHLGDLRILFAGNKLQGIFARINPNFAKSQANNLHFGGYPQTLFGHYQISKKGVDLMIADMKKSGLNEESEEIKKAKALYDLLKKVDFLTKIKIFKQYPIIGADALLTKDQDGNYQYKINEINLTSPMGQTQLILLQTALLVEDSALGLLEKDGLVVDLKEYQILSDYFVNQDEKLILKAQEILLRSVYFKGLIGLKMEELLMDNYFAESLGFLSGKTTINQKI